MSCGAMGLLIEALVCLQGEEAARDAERAEEGEYGVAEGDEQSSHRSIKQASYTSTTELCEAGDDEGAELDRQAAVNVRERDEERGGGKTRGGKDWGGEGQCLSRVEVGGALTCWWAPWSVGWWLGVVGSDLVAVQPGAAHELLQHRLRLGIHRHARQGQRGTQGRQGAEVVMVL